MKQIFNIIIALVIIGVIVFMSAAFTVKERERALKLQFGEVVVPDYEPGLHWRIPLIQEVRKFSARLQTLDSQPERFLTSEKKNLIVDSFVKWRVGDTLKFFTRVGGDIDLANQRLDQVIKDGLRAQFSKREVQEVVSGDRIQIMNTITELAKDQASELGIEVVDVRIKRVDLPEDVSESVYDRMRTERQQVASELRAQGEEAKLRIESAAERERDVILARANRDAAITRGEGDARAAEIYAGAFSDNESFYDFYRSLESYRKSFAQGQDLMVIDPKETDYFDNFSEFSSGN